MAAASSSFTISRLLSPPKASSLSATISSYSTRYSFSLLPLKLRPQKFPNHPTPTKPISNFSTTTAPKIFPTISVGDKLPDSTLSYFNSANELQTTTVSSLTKSKKTILFAVPGAFTPTCSQKHLPGFIEKSGELKVKGIDAIACISVNDAFVMKAWKDDLGIQDEVLMLSDGNGDFTRAIGCELDLSDKPVGLGVRSRRYAMLVEDGVVKVLNLEQGGSFTFSGADDMLKLL